MFLEFMEFLSISLRAGEILLKESNFHNLILAWYQFKLADYHSSPLSHRHRSFVSGGNLSLVFLNNGSETHLALPSKRFSFKTANQKYIHRSVASLQWETGAFLARDLLSVFHCYLSGSEVGSLHASCLACMPYASQDPSLELKCDCPISLIQVLICPVPAFTSLTKEEQWITVWQHLCFETPWLLTLSMCLYYTVQTPAEHFMLQQDT